MRPWIFAFACLACAVYGRRLQIADMRTEGSSSAPDALSSLSQLLLKGQQVEERSPLMALAASRPAAAWQNSMSSLAASRRASPPCRTAVCRHRGAVYMDEETEVKKKPEVFDGTKQKREEGNEATDEQIKIAELEAKLNAMKMKEKAKGWQEEAQQKLEEKKKEEQAKKAEIDSVQGLAEAKKKMYKIPDGFDRRTMSWRPAQAKKFWGDDYVPLEQVSPRWSDDLPDEPVDWVGWIGKTVALALFCYAATIPVGEELIDPLILNDYTSPGERASVIAKRNEAAGGIVNGPEDIPELKRQLLERNDIMSGKVKKPAAADVFPSDQPSLLPPMK